MLRTDTQKETICNNCALAKTADLIGDSHMLLIVRDLLSGPKRFSDFVMTHGGVSTRTLTKKLKTLEDVGLVTRTESDSSRSLYILTSKGKGLKKVMDAMRSYGEAHLQK